MGSALHAALLRAGVSQKLETRVLDNPNQYSVSTSSEEDRFGTAVAVDGDHVVVGAYQEDDAGGESSGKAYIFSATTGNLLRVLDNPNAYGTGAFNYFGHSVSLSGHYAIIGAYNEGDSGGGGSGKAYVFDVTTGTLLRTLDNPGVYASNTSDNFGYSVAISGNHALVGAYQEDDAGGTSSGKAYIFDVATGALLHTLDNPNAYGTSASDGFGQAVAISGNYGLVGASSEDDSSGRQSGKAYIFDVTTGALHKTLSNPNAYGTSADDQFGYSVAISGNYAIVGARLEDDAGGSGSGKAYIFDVTTGALHKTLSNPNPHGTSGADFFSSSVAIGGGYALVGAANEDYSGVASGSAYLFDVETGALLRTLHNPSVYGTEVGGGFGGAVSLSSDHAVIGVPQEDDSLGVNSGKVYIFGIASATPPLALNNPNAYGTSVSDNFGRSVAISGNYAVVGAHLEDAAATDSGRAYIFDVRTGRVHKSLSNPNAYGTGAGDNFGYSVAISGGYAVISAVHEDDASGSQAGKVYVFDVATGVLLHTLDNPNPVLTSAYNRFGHSVAASGSYVVVGTPDEGDGTYGYAGKVYVFDVATGALLHTLDNPNAYGTAQNDGFGYSVAISGNYVIAGARDEDDAGGGSSGKAYIFDVATGALLHTLDNPNAYASSIGDCFGSSVAISGNYAIVGAYQESDSGGSRSGKAYVFDVTTGSRLRTLSNPNAYGTAVSDYFGWSVAISGSRAVVGAYGEGDSAGLQSGKAYVFDVVTGDLLSVLDNPNPYASGANDWFGYAVGISGDAAIVGAYGEGDSAGTASGKAYLFPL